MTKASNYAPGGDAQAIARIANDHFSSFEKMFKEHGWPERGSKLMTSAPKRIVETYGSVKNFEARYAGKL